MAKSYNTRPSIFLAISHPVDAYWLDRAVMHFGSALEAALEKCVAQGNRRKPMSEAQQRAKTEQTLARWRGADAVKRKFRDPMSKFV
jgi:hypothetical protein